MQRVRTVFVVDDDSAIRDALQLLLTVSGYRVELYASASQFLESFQSPRPGCLLLDIYMPGMDGLDLLEELKNRNIPLPIIMFTGHGDRKLARQALNNGVMAFLEKPFTSQALIKQIEKALKCCK